MLGASVAAISVEGVDAFLQQAASPGGRYPDLDYLQLDSWIVIRPDNTATFFVGKTDLGQGTGTAFRQIMADELDIAFDNTSCVMGSTDVTVDQGGSGGSDALQTDGYPMRRVAAEARRVLLEMAAAHFGVPVTWLSVNDGVITTRQGDTAERTITYGELIGGKKFNVTLTGRNIDATTGRAPLKPVQAMKNVGRSPRRDDIPAKVNGTQRWAVDMKVPGMLHARNVRPPVVGATLKAIDESSIKDVPGVVKVVSRGNYVAVVCEREENAVRAARQLKIEWTPPASKPFPASDDLFTYMRSTTPSSTSKPVVSGDLAAAFAAAATTVEARYDVPFQGHTSFGPAHAMADPSNGQLTIYSNDMKSYGMRNGVAQFLKMPRENIRVVWMQGPQCYGRTAADDAGFEAAFLATELGRPVRVQWSRQEETAWDTKGPAYAVDMRGALDAGGQLIALDYDARAADYNHAGYNEPDTVLIAQLMGQRKAQPASGRASFPSDKYTIANRRMAGSVLAKLSGDGGPALSASLFGYNYFSPGAVAIDAAGNLFIPQAGANRIREVPLSAVTLKRSADSIDWTGPQSQAIDVSPSLGGPLAYLVRIPADAGWLTANRASGRTGEPFTLTADTTALAPGIYKTTVTVAIPAVNLQATLPITLKREIVKLNTGGM